MVLIFTAQLQPMWQLGWFLWPSWRWSPKAGSYVVSIVSDACLTVAQTWPTTVTSVDTLGNTQIPCAWQSAARAAFCGIQIWRGFWNMSLAQSIWTIPCIAEKWEYVTNAVIPKFNQKYKIRHDLVEEPGGELSFLKGSVIIQPHVNQTARLFELRDIKPTLHSKKTPAHPEINEPDVSKSFSTLVQISLNASLAFDI